jgi:hypothetical protein
MEIVEGLFEVVKQIPLLFLLHHYVVNVGFNISPNLRLQDDVNTLMIHAPPQFLVRMPSLCNRRSRTV